MSNPLSNRWTLKINIMNANGAMADRDWSPESDAIDNEEIKTKQGKTLISVALKLEYPSHI